MNVHIDEIPKLSAWYDNNVTYVSSLTFCADVCDYKHL